MSMTTTNEPANSGRKTWRILQPCKSRTDPDKTYWNRVGIAYTNRDGSINLFCDSWPSMSNQLQLRDADEPDRRAGAAGSGGGGGGGGPLFNPADSAALAAGIANAHASPGGGAGDVPF